MADPYIDQYETISYGNFAADQIERVFVGQLSPIDAAARELATRLRAATSAMRIALTKAGGVEAVSYRAQEGGTDPLKNAKQLLVRLSRYAESRDNGKALQRKLLSGSVSVINRRRPTKIAATLAHAIEQVKAQKDQLPEHKTWITDLTAAHEALVDLDNRVRTARQSRREMTPAVTAARQSWLRIYGGVKMSIEGFLRLAGRERLMPEIFDDLAEVHRAPNVSDDLPAPAATPPAPSPAPSNTNP